MLYSFDFEKQKSITQQRREGEEGATAVRAIYVHTPETQGKVNKHHISRERIFFERGSHVNLKHYY